MDSHFRGNDKEECGNDRGGGFIQNILNKKGFLI